MKPFYHFANQDKNELEIAETSFFFTGEVVFGRNPPKQLLNEPHKKWKKKSRNLLSCIRMVSSSFLPQFPPRRFCFPSHIGTCFCQVKL
jgi:hypothetical protein